MTDFDTIGLECHRCGCTSEFTVDSPEGENALTVQCKTCGNVDVWEA